MSVTVKFECGGCFDVADGIRSLERRFVGVTGKSYGFGRWEYDSVQNVAPNGWVAFDPYTGACYCPKCWKEIQETAT